MPQVAKARPVPGAVTQREVKIRVCKTCGCVVDTGDLCFYGCQRDGDHKKGTYIVAVYERTDKFLRDEEGK